MQVRLRPELVLRLLQIARLCAVGGGVAWRSIGFRHVAGTSLAGLIDHIDRVALADEVLCPAFASVGRPGINGGGAAAPMIGDDVNGLRSFCRGSLFTLH